MHNNGLPQLLGLRLLYLYLWKTI